MAKTKGIGATLPVVFHNWPAEHNDDGHHRFDYKTLTNADSPYTILDGDPDYFFLNTTAGNITINLPTVADNAGRAIRFFKTIATNIATIDGEGAETINGQLTWNLLKQYAELCVLSNASEWFIDPRSHLRLRCKYIDLAIPKRPAANPPGEGTEDAFPTLDFDDTVEESIFLVYPLPLDYKPGGIVNVAFHFFVDTAPVAPANVVWGVEYKKLSAGDVFDFGAGTLPVTTIEAITIGTPANDKVVHETNDMTLISIGWAEHDLVLMRFHREPGNILDTFVGDVRMCSIHLEYEADISGNT